MVVTWSVPLSYKPLQLKGITFLCLLICYKENLVIPDVDYVKCTFIHIRSPSKLILEAHSVEMLFICQMHLTYYLCFLLYEFYSLIPSQHYIPLGPCFLLQPVSSNTIAAGCWNMSEVNTTHNNYLDVSPSGNGKRFTCGVTWIISLAP